MIEACSVSWLTRYIKTVIEGDLRLTNLWTDGEISNLSRSQRGHVYFTLKEGDSQIRCVMFQRQYRGAPLENGAQVLAHGNVTLYEQRGDVQIIVDFVQPAGVGARHAEFERLKEKLESEGLFDEARKRALPAFPHRIGVVTSPSGAVFHDICNVLSRRWPLAEILLAPTTVQGAEAATGIAQAIRQLNDEPHIDVIIVARGGGSIEELWPFNEEIVARAIYTSATPVVSGVGHETDFTIADFVADVRTPTPSAAAETVAPDRREILARIGGAIATAGLTVRNRIDQTATGIERAAHRLERGVPNFSRLFERLHSQMRHATTAADRSLEKRSTSLDGHASQLRSLNPGATLARGYAVVQLRDGKQAITSVKQAKGKDKLDIHVADGRIPAEVSRQYGF
ncbi:MAG: exodeoxyribonuclease VII large subunit [Chloroflexi bacterium]|nr:exodeoxyribonuclease VII large subunit [Chloroflexota bacterium]